MKNDATTYFKPHPELRRHDVDVVVMGLDSVGALASSYILHTAKPSPRLLPNHEASIDMPAAWWSAVLFGRPSFAYHTTPLPTSPPNPKHKLKLVLSASHPHLKAQSPQHGH